MADLKFAISSISDGLLVEELENCSPPKPLGSWDTPFVHPFGYSTMNPLDAHSVVHRVKFGSTGGGATDGDGVGEGVEVAVGLIVGLGAGAFVAVTAPAGLDIVLLCP